MTSPRKRSAHVIGLGLIGGSIAKALHREGWSVTGTDLSESTVSSALADGVISGDVPSDNVEVYFVATPTQGVAKVVQAILDTRVDSTFIVTDVAGVKGSIVKGIDDPRFIGGHPMAGSELSGWSGSRQDMFEGCTWVLTPTAATSADSFATLTDVLRSLGANVLPLDHERHDRLVAMASHVPHLIAGALMNEATTIAIDDGALLQLAAGGFRDMTRVSAGDSAIWPDLLIENADAVVASLDAIKGRLITFSALISSGNRTELRSQLEGAGQARRALPGRGLPVDDLLTLRIPVPDRPGVLAQITALASELNANIYDIEISHSVEGQPGVLLLTVGRSDSARLSSELGRKDMRATIVTSK